MSLAVETVDPAALPASTGTYTHGTIVTGAQKLVFVSGQPPWDLVAPVPTDFEAQCRLAWRNVELVLSDAGLTLRHLVKITVFLSDREHRAAHGRIREELLGDHRCAITIIITGIYSEEWLLEIEGIAAA